MSVISSSGSRRGRASERQELIVREIREQIIQGQLAPGSRLPTREALGRQYGAGASMIQRALDRLKEEGFVYSSGRSGTLVSNELPHLTRYAVVFPSVPSHRENWVRFWTALSNEALSLQRAEGRQLPLYYGVTQNPAEGDYQLLLNDVISHRLAGIVFVSCALELMDTPMLQTPSLPRVGIMSASWEINFPVVHPDTDSFFERGLEMLQQKGCRKIAFILPPGLERRIEYLLWRVAELRMKTHSYWYQVVPHSLPRSAHNIVHLMMNAQQAERPDGLIICDDNLVEHSTAGLLAAGAQVGEEIHVVAHCNFPWPTPSAAPVHRLGFDAREVLQTSLQAIDAIRRGERFAPESLIPARFESELSPHSQSQPKIAA